MVGNWYQEKWIPFFYEKIYILEASLFSVLDYRGGKVK